MQKKLLAPNGWRSWIHPGETLCLTAEPDAEGRLGKLRAVSETKAGALGTMMLRMVHDNTDVVLMAQHSFEHAVETPSATVVPGETIAVLGPILSMTPGALSVHTWNPDVRQILITDPRLNDPALDEEEILRPESGAAPLMSFPDGPSAEASDNVYSRRSAWNVRGPFVAVTLGIWVGARRIRLPDLDAALQRDGFAPLPSNHTGGGLDLEIVWERLRLGLGFGGGTARSRHGQTRAQVTTGFSTIGFTTGYEFFRHRAFRVFASTGIFMSELSVDARAEGFTLFTQRLEPWEGNSVEHTHWLVPWELGLETLLPLGRVSSKEYWGLTIGPRMGWVQQLGGGSWRIHNGDRHRHLGSDPNVDLSGPVVRFLVGIGGVRIPD